MLTLLLCQGCDEDLLPNKEANPTFHLVDGKYPLCDTCYALEQGLKKLHEDEG